MCCWWDENLLQNNRSMLKRLFGFKYPYTLYISLLFNTSIDFLYKLCERFFDQYYMWFLSSFKQMRPRNASDSENLAASLALAEVRKGKHTPWGSWSYERGKQSLLFVVISFSYIYLRMITDIQLGHVPLYMCICVEGRGKLGELWVVGDVRSFDKK